jgi:hypothetical protein
MLSSHLLTRHFARAFARVIYMTLINCKFVRTTMIKNNFIILSNIKHLYCQITQQYLKKKSPNYIFNLFVGYHKIYDLH